MPSIQLVTYSYSRLKNECFGTCFLDFGTSRLSYNTYKLLLDHAVYVDVDFDTHGLDLDPVSPFWSR